MAVSNQAGEAVAPTVLLDRTGGTRTAKLLTELLKAN
jgi:hypothetical protein